MITTVVSTVWATDDTVGVSSSKGAYVFDDNGEQSAKKPRKS